jgi:hypothetical protein
MTDRPTSQVPGRTCDRTVDIAAYLAGELGGDDEISLRTHADLCGICGPELASLRSLVDRVRSVRNEELDEEWELPPAVGAGLFERALREPSVFDVSGDAAVPGTGPLSTFSAPAGPRRRRRSVAIAAAGVAFAFLAGAGSAVGLQAAFKKDPPVGEKVRLQLISARTPSPSVAPVPAIRAWAWIGSAPAGTYATLYTKGLPAGQHYYMWFEKADGTRVALGSFRSSPDGTMWLKCPGSSALVREEIVAIGASTSAGDVLRADLLSTPAGG